MELFQTACTSEWVVVCVVNLSLNRGRVLVFVTTGASEVGETGLFLI
jgi:hypothetical protein